MTRIYHVHEEVELCTLLHTTCSLEHDGWCTAKDKEIPAELNATGFPSWCPLPEKEKQ